MKRPQSFCIFCGGPKLTHEHIWSDWLDEILPRGWDRGESYTNLTNKSGAYKLESIPRRIKQGAVHTKSARKVCEKCNSGWMSEIVVKAKPIAKKLILGEQVNIARDDQINLANWLGLSTLMVNTITKSRHKLPGRDAANFFMLGTVPSHWFIMIGYYDGPEITAFNHNSLPLILEDPSKPKTSPYDSVGPEVLKFVTDTFTSILGRLYTIIHVFTPSSTPLAHISPVGHYSPHLGPIWPIHFEIVPWPPPRMIWIGGSLNPDGGLARDLATRLNREALAALTAKGILKGA